MRCTPSHLALPFLAVGLLVLPPTALRGFARWASAPRSASQSSEIVVPSLKESLEKKSNKHATGVSLTRGDIRRPHLVVETAQPHPAASSELNRWPINLLKPARAAFVVFDNVTFWANYKWRIIAAAAIVILQSLLILGLLFERKRKRAAALLLAESEERYRNVVETQTELICRYLPDTTLTFVNDAYCRFFSKTREQLIGKKYIDLIPAHAHASTRRHIKSLIEKPRIETDEHEVILPDGSIGWQQWIDHVISSGKQIELQGIGRDITERKKAESALRLSEEFNRGIVESSTDCIKILDVDGNLVYMSEPGQRLLEMDSFEPFKGKSWINFWNGDEQDRARKAISLAREGSVGLFQGAASTLKGNPRWWHTVITPIRTANGSVERLLAISRDITEQKLTLQVVQETEERFAKAFKANPQPMSLTTLADGKYLDVNESFLRMSGYSRDEVIGHTSVELRVFDTAEQRHDLLVEPVLEAGGARNFEMNFRTKSGASRVLLSSAELLDISGEKCILVASSDISERKALEEELQLSEREFSTLVENSPDIICRLDRNLRYIYISPTFERVTGVPNERLIGKTPQEVALTDFDWKRFQECCQEAISTSKSVPNAFEYNERHYWTRVIPEFSRDGLVESVMTISEDVTDRIRSEQELLQLTVRLFSLQDEERRRIARELHDGTAQNLFAITVNLARLGQLPSSESNEIRQLVSESQSLCDQSLQEIRTLSYLLHPPLLDQAGLVSALQWYVEGFTKRSGIHVDVSAQPIGRLPSDVEMALFRVVQEALTNVRRHSRSTTASIRLERKQSEVILEIRDSGQGLTSPKQPEDSGQFPALGVGIPGMRQRIRQLGGTLEINSHHEGTTISAVVPLTNGASNGKNPSRGRS
jgi:PAS domain S-box-containing protein